MSIIVTHVSLSLAFGQTLALSYVFWMSFYDDYVALFFQRIF
jgi:hypothetical protein